METNIEKIKKDTMELLGLTDPNDVSYITEELVKDYLENSQEDIEETNEKNEKLTPYGVYGNSLTYSGNYVHYHRNDKGTTNYGCGNNKWKWTKKQGDTIRYIEKCSNGKGMYLLQRA